MHVLVNVARIYPEMLKYLGTPINNFRINLNPYLVFSWSTDLIDVGTMLVLCWYFSLRIYPVIWISFGTIGTTLRYVGIFSRSKVCWIGATEVPFVSGTAFCKI